MNMERAFINPRLAAAAAATLEQLALLLRQNGLVDTLMSEARLLAVTPGDTGALQINDDKLLIVRHGAMAAIVRLRTGHSLASVAGYVPQMFAVREAAYAFAVTVQSRISTSNPNLGPAIRLAILAWDLRDWSGRQTTTLIGYIGQHLPIAGEQAESLAEYRGRIEQKWSAMVATAAAVGSPDVLKTLAGVETGFWAHGGEAYAIWVVPNRGRTLDLDPNAFVVAIAPILNNIIPLRDSTLNVALWQGDVDIAMRRVRFLLALGLLLLTACAAAAAAAAAATRWFDRRVVRLVELITTTILALEWNLHTAVAAGQGQDCGRD
jgi:hypothetical protein